MSRNGHGWDNAVAECLFKTLKVELGHCPPGFRHGGGAANEAGCFVVFPSAGTNAGRRNRGSCKLLISGGLGGAQIDAVSDLVKGSCRSVPIAQSARVQTSENLES